MTAPERERSKLLPVRTAFAGLMALLMLALLGFAQAGISASAVSLQGGSSISAARQGDAIALLRTSGKAQALEVRASRPLPVKPDGGNPGVLAPAADFLVIGQVLPAEMGVTPLSASATGSRANQPRAPPAA
ncbi:MULTISPECIES: hypothetical protein [unclassified Mesorhizobium]|uniref:hypothetical protein n=1 Tax=unclassified Mesorhizobium TaxID=325217 RepID=UPI000FD8B38E|nr:MULTISPECIES: hypothetical protein [unclassified Mesorhizobium]TGQ17408.1 hypothetical protein EN862_008085 [Mesorhizobium sp. M2E.F.Ca.ET.219.01.1.1]TGT76435.1 hypothetical protein EN809_002120 [Mesorhizobium sp. M2E.F.Ca.ET.166.01.1.1]TGW02550.1 hypothetical protein EN797_002120 [Mesorhizobium sp. M2E.F.Ca.ET.154.01.1.1]